MTWFGEDADALDLDLDPVAGVQGPTPAGVPVREDVAGSRVITEETNDSSSATPCSSWRSGPAGGPRR